MPIAKPNHAFSNPTFHRKNASATVKASYPATNTEAITQKNRALPLGAMLLAGSLSAMAQTAPSAGSSATSEPSRSLSPVVVQEKKATPQEGKDAVRATTTTTGKGNQALRDIPQSMTVVTEKLMDDRNLDTLKDVLHNTAGVTFMAAEGGEEDIRLRGFSLATTGDIFIDGMRDPAFYDRDTFNNDRIDLLRGSASMLFGRGSTGGAANQVSKIPRAVNDHEVSTTVGNHSYARITGDFNWKTGEDAGLRVNVMRTKADNNGAGSGVDKEGVAAAYRFGIGTKNEFLVSLSHLNNTNPHMNYGLPWIRPTATSGQDTNTIIAGLKPTAYYGLDSDYNAGTASTLGLSHIHRFGADTELKTQLRKGEFTRDQRASAIRFAGLTATAAAPLVNNPAVGQNNFGPNTVFNRGTNLKVQNMDTLYVQSDFSSKFDALGYKHELLAGIDYSKESKIVYAARSATQGGVVPVKPQIRASQDSGGGSVNEASRVFRDGNAFTSVGYGVYAQDLVKITSEWKLLGGLRYDSMKGNYSVYAIPTNAAGPVTTTAYEQSINEWSKRVGLLYQPNALHSYHFSYGSSFNTSGDVYSYSALSANTPPEQSRNIEIGAKLDSANKQFTTRLALFHSSKTNERNTDPDTAATQLLLSGKRHSAGIEVDITGRLTPKWEVYGSYMWMPVARVDKAALTATGGGSREGDRPGLSPKYSGTLWSTYQLTPQWRFGAGINFRGEQAPADIGTPAAGIYNAPAYTTMDLLAEYRINEQYAVKANISNITDKLYADSVYRGHYIAGAGRLVQVNLSAKF